MIILDIEWNRGYDKKPLDEILQIGAVRIETLGGPIVDTFNAYIHPKVHKKYGPGAKDLPELDRFKASTLDFAGALDRFIRWCGRETVFAAWGADDFDVLCNSCTYWDLPSPTFPTIYDLQSPFSRISGAAHQQIALWRAVAYCQIPDCFDFHNALNDAVYTAILTRYLSMEDLTYVPASKSKEKLLPKLPTFCPDTFPEQPKRRVGPFSDTKAAMDSRQTRRVLCPLCQKEFWIHQWEGVGSHQYFGRFRCPEHGLLLCRLTLSKGDDQQWRGRQAIPALDQETQKTYQLAMSGPRHQCKGSNLHRNGRKRHAKAKVAATIPFSAVSERESAVRQQAAASL